MFPFGIIHTQAQVSGLPYLLIGGHAVNIYAEPRATLDVDLLVRNAQDRDATFRETSSGYALDLPVDLDLAARRDLGRWLSA